MNKKYVIIFRNGFGGMEKLETTLLLIIRDDEILLALKKRGFGMGLYNGVGGKLKDGEASEEAMLRETKEEIGITPIDYYEIGLIKFIEMVKGVKTNVTMHVYRASSWEGEIVESEEMRPKWFKIKDIPLDNMFPDDIYWMPIFLEGKNFEAYFEFDEDFNLLDKKITIKEEKVIR